MTSDFNKKLDNIMDRLYDYKSPDFNNQEEATTAIKLLIKEHLEAGGDF
jgi:hypothetical protein